MSVRVEWMSASGASGEIFGPGDEWVGMQYQDDDSFVLAIAGDEVTAIEGTLEELKAFAEELLRTVEAAILFPNPESEDPGPEEEEAG